MLTLGLRAELAASEAATRQGAHAEYSRLLTLLAPLFEACLQAEQQSAKTGKSLLAEYKAELNDLHIELRALLFESGHLLTCDELLSLGQMVRNWSPNLAAACQTAVELKQTVARLQSDIARGAPISSFEVPLALIAVAQAKRLVSTTGGIDTNQAANDLVDVVLSAPQPSSRQTWALS